MHENALQNQPLAARYDGVSATCGTLLPGQLPYAECTGQSILRKERGSTCQRSLLRVLSANPNWDSTSSSTTPPCIALSTPLAISRASPSSKSAPDAAPSLPFSPISPPGRTPT